VKTPQDPERRREGGRPAAERPFVDREEFIAPVHSALRQPPRTKPLVLVYYGGAGIGKSRLQRELSSQMAADPGILTATLDFHIPIYRQPETALLTLRNALRDTYQVRFPSFDLAYAVCWQKTHPDTALSSVDSRQHTAYRAERGGKEGTERQRDEETGGGLEPGSLLSQLLDESGKLPLIGLVPRIIAAVGSRQNTVDREWWTERGERELEDVPQMEPGAIVDRLPMLWAADIKDFLGATSRKEGGSHHDDERRTRNEERARQAVLFIDSYEKLWETGDRKHEAVDSRQEAVDRGQKTDEWVRELVKQLPEVLWVICGRQKLRWEEVERDWGDSLSQHEIGALPVQSARQFLQTCDITNGQIQDAIVKGSGGVPHYLDLAVDTVQSARYKVQDAEFRGGSPEELVGEFTRRLDKPEVETLKVLSAARFWYYGLFEHLMTEYQTGYPLSGYDGLSRFSFIKEGAAPGTRTMHDLMRDALQEEQSPELRKRVHLFLHELYAKQLQGLDVKGITDTHRTALTEAFYHGRQAKNAAELWSWFKAAQGVFDEAGQHRLLVPLLREVVALVEAGLGHVHSSVAESLFELARQLDASGEYDEAEPLYRRALAMAEKELGPEDRIVLDCLSSLAELLRKRARYEEAEVVCRRVVELRDKLGRSAIDQAEALDSLGAVLTEENKYAEAERLFRRAIAICEGELGLEHRKTGMKLSNLGCLLCTQRRYAEAEPIYRRALSINEQTLGLNHPDLVFTLDGLASTLYGLGRYTEAEPLYRRSLKLCEENLGPEHPDTAICMNNLGTMLEAQKRLAEALILQRRALEAHQKKMGPEHPLTIRMANNLIVGLVGRGSYAEAEPMILSALAAREKKLGSDNPATFFLVHWGGVMYRKQGRYAEADAYLRRAVEVTTRILGPEHPDTLGSVSALATLRELQGRRGEAESLHRDVLAKRERVRGTEHPQVAETANKLAGICCHDGRYAEAEAFYRRALAIREKTFGPDHVFVAEPLEGLAKVCEQTGRAAEAQELSARVARIREKAAQAAGEPG